jgi:hypothetical protein
LDRESLDEVQRLWARASNPDRLYPLRSNPDGFFTGRLPDGRQAIAFFGEPEEVVLLLFNKEGDYLGPEPRRVSTFPLTEENPFSVDKAHDFCGKEFGFVPRVIFVKRFHDPEWLISLEPLPSCYRQFVEDPVRYCRSEFTSDPVKDPGSDVRECHCLLDEVRRFVEDGRFEFNFYNDFWMDRDGWVECS